METKTKLPKKILSMFLSLLMAISCFSVALPALAPSADAATTDQWNALKQAFADAKNAGCLATSNASFTASGSTYTLNDDTNKGYYYAIADIIFEIAKEDRSSYNHNIKMRDYIKSNAGSLTTYQKNFIDSLLPVTGNYAYYSGNVYTQSSAEKSGSAPSAPGQKFSAVSYTVTVTRTVKAAIAHDCATPNSVPANIETKVSLKTNAAVYTTTRSAVTRSQFHDRPSSDGGDWTEYFYTAYRDEYYYNNDYTLTSATSACPDLKAIQPYIDYVAAAAFKNGYDEWKANNAVIYSKPVEEIKDVEANYNVYYNPITTIDTYYLELYVPGGNDQIADYTLYATSCTGAVTAVQYKPIVDWIMYGTHLDGYIDRDDYDSNTVRNPEVRARIQALLDQSVSMENQIESLPQGVKNALRDFYGYNVSFFNDYQETLKDLLQVYDGTDMYDELIFRLENDETKTYNGKEELWGAINYESSNYDPTETCPVDDDMLEQVISWYDAKINVLNGYDVENVNKVFADNYDGKYNFGNVKQFRDNLKKEKAWRGYEETFYADYYAYFEGIRYEIWTMISSKSIQDTIATAESKLTGLKQSYNSACAEVGEFKAKQIYGNYYDEMRVFVNSLYDIVYNRVKDTFYNLLTVSFDGDATGYFDGGWADEITNTNFSAVKRAVAEIRKIADTDYLWLKNNNRNNHDLTLINDIYDHLGDYDTAVNKVVESKWTAFKQVQLDQPAGSGYYYTRYALDKDMARDPGENEDYVVTEQKILTVINKLDSFITAEEFVKLIGLYRENEEIDPETGETLPPVHNLSMMIEDLLHSMLFTDEMINMLVSMIFPMLVDTIGGLIKDLFKKDGMLSDYVTTPTDSSADGAVDLGKFGLTLSTTGVEIDRISGTINAFLDGNAGTSRISDAFGALGINIYPKTFANSLANSPNSSAYSALISDLRSAGENWQYFDNKGNKNGEVDAEDFEKYVWGVNDYDSFYTVIGDIFSSLLPLLRILLTNHTTTLQTGLKGEGHLIKITAIEPNELDVHAELIGFISASASATVSSYADVNLTFTGNRGYENVWAPIFETLGVTNTVSSYATDKLTVENPISTTFGTSEANATAAQFANALFVPLLSLIETLAEKPIDTVLGIIPNLMQSIAYGCIQPMFQGLATSINLTLRTSDFSMNGTDFLGDIIALFSGTVEDALVDNLKFDFALNLGDMLDLQDLLGVSDITDINGIIESFLSSEEEGGDGSLAANKISIPAINAGKWASMGHVETMNSVRQANYNTSALGAGKRYTIVADKADLLYDLLSFVLDFLAVEGNVSGLMATLGNEGLDIEIEKLLGGIDADDAVAALVELFLPQDYSVYEYDWFKSNEEGSVYKLSSADFVYLKYANNWTREKAEYLYNNVDVMANTIVNMIDPDMLAEYGGNVNYYLLDVINSIFDNEGIVNVVELVAGLGEGLAGEDNEMIVNLISDQIEVDGRNAGLDILSWYNSFGYLLYDYTQVDEETGLLPATAPKKPGEEGYVNSFPNLKVEVVEGEFDSDGRPVTIWSINDDGTWRTLVDGAADAREVFTAIFCELIKPISPILGVLFTGTDLGLFNSALVINGYEVYSSAIIPVYEMFGIYDMLTQAEYNAAYKADPEAGFEYLVNKLFDRISELLTVSTVMVDGMMVEYGPVQKIVDMLPDLFYFLQSDGLTTLLKNLLEPIWVLVDTIRPVIDADLDAFIHVFLTSELGLVYDRNDTTNYPSAPLVDMLVDMLELEIPAYDAVQAEKDKPLVDGIFELTLEDLSLETIYFVVETMFGIDLAPLSYALEGMCVDYERDGEHYGVHEYRSKSGKTAYRLDYNGPDTITVTVSALLDLLRYGDNAKAIDEMLGLVGDIAPDADLGNVSAAGLLEALITIFEDKPDDMGEQPNWDYLLEGKMVYGVTAEGMNISKEWEDGNYEDLINYNDLSIYHSINNLNYYTDWTEETAKATDEMLKVILDYVVTMIDEDATSFNQFIVDLLDEEVFTGEILKKLADAIGSIYDLIPAELVQIIDNMMDIQMSAWLKYVEEVEILDENGNGTDEHEHKARADFKWWADPTSEDYVDTRDEFLAAVKEILMPVSNLLGVIFLGSDYKLFYTMDRGPGSVGYGDDAIVINGLNAYAKGLVPIFEAFGLDLTNYKPEKYETGNDIEGNMIYNEELFVNDFIDILALLLDTLAEDPLNYIIDNLPGVLYFLNANGLSVSLMNIVDSLVDVLDTVNTMLDPEDRIDLTNIEGIDLTNLTLGNILGLLETFAGIHIRSDLADYITNLYVGQLKAFTSVNGLTAFTMEYSTVEERHDMITIVLALLLELVEDKGTYIDGNGAIVEYNNAAAIDALINGDDEEPKNYVQSIVGLIKDPSSVIYKDINWKYFDETIDLTKPEEDGSIKVPGYAFQYLNYTTDWTYNSAAKTADGLEAIILSVLQMTGNASENDTLSSALKGMLNLEDVFTGATLQQLLDLVRPLLFGEDAVLNQSLIQVIGALLGADLTQWNNEYAFENYDAANEYETDEASGLRYRTVTVNVADDPATEDVDETNSYAIKTYAIETKDEFITGATVLFQPAYKLLAWLLFGDSYEFFNGNTEATKDEVLITLQGSDGYKNGLVLLLEALGCSDLKKEAAYKNVAEDGTVTVDMALFVKDLADVLFTRIDEILNNPVTEITNLLPELLYFINAGGLQVVVGNLLASPISLVNEVGKLLEDESISIDALVQDLLRDALENDELVFTLDGINLEYIFELAEMLTGLEIIDVVGQNLEYFHIGEIIPYPSASEKLAYKMRFSTEEDFADFITILLSFVIDIALYDGNAAALETLLELDAGLVSTIVATIKGGWTVDVKDIDWFYFDKNTDISDIEPGDTIALPERTINYLSYASDWTEETADYVYDNRNEIIAAVLEMTGNGNSTLADVLANEFSLEKDLYTAEMLNKIIDALAGLGEELDTAITMLLDIVIGVDLTVFSKMDKFTDDEINGRQDFVGGLYIIFAPIFNVLDWLLFGEPMEFFDKDTDVTQEGENDIEVLLTIPGSEGYYYGLAPIFEMLGVEVPAVTDGQGTEELFFPLINNILARVEAILKNPVDEALALIPNLLYFINSNGLSISVQNLLGAVFSLLDVVNEQLPEEDKIDVNELLNDLIDVEGLTIDVYNLRLLPIVEIAENITGLKIVEILTAAKIDNFYFGQLEYFTSVNGKPAFNMVFSEEEGGADILTIIVNLLLEIVLYKNDETGANNAKALETLLRLDEGTVTDIIDIIPMLGAEPNYEDYDWAYPGDAYINETTHQIENLPTTPFVNYFTYKSNVSQETANYFYDNLDNFVTAILRMTGKSETADEVSEILNNKWTLYQGEYLNSLVGLTGKLYDLAAEELINTAGLLLDIDISAWEGLSFPEGKMSRDDFIDGLVKIITPLYRVLDWLLFGKSIELFVENEDGTTTLLKVAGGQGYKYGLVPLFEALGVDLPETMAVANCANMFEPVIESVLVRFDEIMGDVLTEGLELLPNLLYFINAGGASTAVKNLAAAVLNVINLLNEKGIAEIDLVDLIGIDIFNLDLEGVFKILEDEAVLGEGFKFNDAFRGYTTVNADGTVTFTRDVTGENIFQDFYMGEIKPFVSKNGELAYRMASTEEERGDIVVLLLSFALETVLYGDNAAIMDKKFDIESGLIATIAALVSKKMNFTPMNANWVYFLDLTEEELDKAIDDVLAGKKNELPDLIPERTLHYLEYDNNWSEDAVEHLIDNLPEIVDIVISMATDYVDLNNLITTELNIYTNDNVNAIIQGIAGLLKELDEQILVPAGLLLGVDLDELMNFNATSVVDKASFARELARGLCTVDEILDLLLFGEDFGLFTKIENGEPAIISITGNDGYKNGLSLLLSALGVETDIGPIPEADDENGISVSDQVLETILLRVCDRIDEILANPLEEVFDILLNLVYFINADGLTAAVNNIILPANYILDEIGKAQGEDMSLSELIGFDLDNLTFETIAKLLKDEMGLDIWTPVGEYLSKFYFGELEYYEYQSGMGAFKMVYTEEEDKHDFITILLTVVLDVFSYEGNKDALVELFGEDGEAIYNVIMAFLTDSEVQVPMQEPSWILTEFADTGKVLSPITMGSIYDSVYGPLYTREMGEYITKWLPSFVDTMIVLLGIEGKDGNTVNGLEDILKDLIGTSLYKTDLLVTVLDAIKGLIADLKDSIGEELFGHIAAVLAGALDVDLTFWDTYEVTEIAEGDKEAFINELLRMLTPVYPLLSWLLADDDLGFFNRDDNIDGSVTEPGDTVDGNDYVIIQGAEGYKYGIIPVLEAFGCNDYILSYDEYVEKAAGDPEALLRYVIEPLLTRVDELLADPVNEIVDILPGVIYFVNSNGLDTAFKNIINAVLKVLETIEPLTKEKIDIYELLGFDLTAIDIEGLIEELLNGIQEDTGFQLSAVAMEAIKELTVGEVKSYISKTGWDEAYTMVYATGGDKVDLVTIVLRLVLTFISIPENVVALEAILKDNLSGDGYTFLCSLLENFSQMAASEGGMDEIMYTVYQIFYAANVAAHETKDWLADFNGDYSFLNQLFATSDLAFLRQLEVSLGDLLNKYTGDIVDDDEVVPNGFIAFFQAIKDFFQKIIDFFTGLFA